MTAKTLISPVEYLSTSFPDGDQEYVRGELIERGMPDLIHSVLQSETTLLLAPLKKQFGLITGLNLRLQIEPDLFRIPDISLFAPPLPTQRVPNQPPLAVMEIVSYDDRHVDLLTKLHEYYAWGVQNIWVIDPWLREFYVYDADGFHRTQAFQLPAYEFTLTWHALIANFPPGLAEAHGLR